MTIRERREEIRRIVVDMDLLAARCHGAGLFAFEALLRTILLSTKRDLLDDLVAHTRKFAELQDETHARRN